MEKATRQFTKEFNSRLVLQTIYQHDDVSRAEISRITRLTRTTISEIVSGLIDEGLVEEVGMGLSSGGKPPVQVGLVENARQIVCLDLSNPEFRGALVTLRGKILCCEALPQQRQDGPANLAAVFALVDSLLTQASAPILGIAVGTPGLVNSQEGVVMTAVNLGWTQLPLKAELQKRYGLPVYVGNDSHVAALAEYTYGHWNKTPNLLVVKIGEGIGSGIVLDGRLYYGDSYSSGEIGHISVVARGDDERGPLRRCTCGRYGCLETVSSTPAVLREAQRRGELISDELQERSLAPLVKRFTEGDSDCASLVLTAGRCLGAVIATLIAGLNIQKIIIAGDFYAFGEAYLDAVRGEAERRVLPGLMTHTQFAFSTLGADNVLLGVSALVMSQELGIP